MSVSNYWIFLKEWLLKPGTIGAATPSSRKLAKAIALQLPKPINGLVIELGPGTGVITQALLDRGITAQQLVLIERSASFIEHLHASFPQIKIIHGTASKLPQLLGEDVKRVSAVISGLPLKSLPKSLVEEICQAIEDIQTNGNYFIQFTYSWRKSYPYFSQRMCLVHSQTIWRNFPPARIDVFQYQ